MAKVSRFSTQENYDKWHALLAELDIADQEAQLAAQAGVPGMDAILAESQAARDQLMKLINTYFPNGTVSVAG